MNGINTGEIILYQPDNTTRLEVRIEYETVWLTQAQMVELFQTTKQNVSLHINNVFKEGELEPFATVKDYLTVQNEGGRDVFRNIRHYNLDVIISVGYRVKSQRGTQFRQWANIVLKDYLLKGFIINQRIEKLEHQMIEFDLRLKTSQLNESLLQNEIRNLKNYIEAILSDFNEINEDTRIQLELINTMLAELQVKNKWNDTPRKPIGFLKDEK